MTALQKTPESVSRAQPGSAATSLSTLGPYLSRLPDELLLDIFTKVAKSLFPATSRFHSIIDPKVFVIINRYYLINHVRNVSTAFNSFFTQAFYETYHFSFKHHCVQNLESDFLTSVPAPLPRPGLRHFLRSLRIEVVLENYYFTPQTDFSVSSKSDKGRQSRKITSVEEMMSHCPSARFLAGLTQPQFGFAHLHYLDLHVCTDFRHFPADKEFFKVVEEARFVVRARKVTLTVITVTGFEEKKHLQVKVKAAIHVAN